MCVVLKNTVELSQQDCLPGPSAIAFPAIDVFVIRVRDIHLLERCLRLQTSSETSFLTLVTLLFSGNHMHQLRLFQLTVTVLQYAEQVQLAWLRCGFKYYVPKLAQQERSTGSKCVKQTGTSIVSTSPLLLLMWNRNNCRLSSPLNS